MLLQVHIMPEAAILLSWRLSQLAQLWMLLGCGGHNLGDLSLPTDCRERRWVELVAHILLIRHLLHLQGLQQTQKLFRELLFLEDSEPGTVLQAASGTAS